MQVNLGGAISSFEQAKIASLKKENLSGKDDAKLKEQTDKFEALFIKQLLDVSLNADNSMFPDVTGKEIYQSMYNDTMGKQFSGSFGFSKLLFDYLKENR